MININDNIIVKIKDLLQERNWTANYLALEAGISPSTIINWFSRKATPSINALASICETLGITISEFFNEGKDPVELTAQQRELFDEWNLLHKEQKELILAFIKSTNKIVKNCNAL